MKTLRSFKIAKSETPISDFIPYSHHITESIISTKNAEYLSVWKIGGRSHQCSSAEDIYLWIKDLNNTLRGFASAHISLWSHVVRRRVSEYPEAKFDDFFSEHLDKNYRSGFTNYNLMVNDLYLTIVYRPVADSLLSFFSSRKKESLAEKKHRQDTCIKALEDINRGLKNSLRRYDAELLGLYEHNGHMYSSAMEFLAFLINGENRRIPVYKERFANYIAFNRPIFSHWGEIGEIRTISSTRRFGMLEISDCDNHTAPGHLNSLLETNFEYVLTQSFSALSKYAAKGFMQRHQQNLLDAKDVAYEQIAEINEAMNQLVSGQFVMGTYHATLTVFGNDASHVRDHLSSVTASLNDVGIMTKSVDLALEAGFWAQLPANWQYRPRPMPITSQNFLCYSPFHNFMSGKPNGNPWGPAVTVLKSVSGTPVYFNFHTSELDEDATDQRRLGNTIITGKSGSGKTVLLGFLLSQAQKFKPTIVAFDKDRGMEITIRAMGGRYLPLKTGRASGFNPFQLSPTAANLIFLKQFVKKLAVGNTGISHEDEEEIDQAVNTLMNLIDAENRNLSVLCSLLPNPINDGARPSVCARLTKWTQAGEYGWLFDNAKDALNLDTHRLYGFDVTEFLDNVEICAPVMMYLIYRTESMIDGRKFVYVFDEFWKALSDEYFEDLAKNKQKTIRKQNGIFVFATQEPSDALDSPIAKTLVQQCATYIFLPNDKADYDDYTKGFKLTDTEYSIIRELSENSRRFLIKQGSNSVLAELNLHGFDDELLILSGTPDNAALVEEIIEQVGEAPKEWIPIFIEEARKRERT